MTNFFLASGSPRRQDLLAQFGLPFKVEASAIDEVMAPDESAPKYIQRVALEKAKAVGAHHPKAFVLGADTGVVLDGQCLGKPENASEASAMLQSLSGRSHEVMSSVALLTPTHQVHQALVTTTVWFASLPKEWIDRYVSSGDPMDKAGAYAIQNEAGLFVSRIEGSYSNVVGLPLYETGQLLRQAGLWHPQSHHDLRDTGVE